MDDDLAFAIWLASNDYKYDDKLFEAFKAGIEFGYFEGAEHIAELEGVGTCLDKPKWLKDVEYE